MATFTDKFIRSVKVPETGRLEIVDGSLPGFVLRVTAADVRSWAVRYKVRGAGLPQQRVTIGVYPAVSLAVARERAKAILEAAHGGVDLVQRERQEKEATEAARIAAAENTIDKAADGYEAYYRDKWRDSSADTCEVEMGYIRKAFKGRPLTTITAREVFDFLEEVGEVKPTQANRVWGRFNAFMGWAVFKGHLPVNPCAGVKRQLLEDMDVLQPEVPRDRVLNRDEIRRVLLASDAMGYPSGWYVRFLLLTGQREKQALKMNWSDIDERGNWVIRPEMRKTARFDPRRQHLVPLVPQARAILEKVRLVQPKERVHVWTSSHKPEQPYSGLATLKKRLDRLSGVKGWVLHDLRRTARTYMAECGVPGEHAERVIDHAVGGKMDRVYNLYEYFGEKQEALQRWADCLDGIMSEAPVTPVE
ncbi:tyrosine-type recombinase/integrase [Azospirillum argentinense]